MPSDAMVPVLVTMMLITGVCNTLLTKYQVCFEHLQENWLAGADGQQQDLQCVRNCDDPDHRQYFEQPVIQT
jgi:hypothetical protein